MAVFLMLPLVSVVVGAGFLVTFMSGNDTDGFLTRGGLPTEVANQELGEYLPIFRAAEEKYGVDWTILGALAKLQTGCGSYPKGSVSSTGEVGFIRVFPRAWSGALAPGARNDPGWRPTPDPPAAPYFSTGMYVTEEQSNILPQPGYPGDSHTNILEQNKEEPIAATKMFNADLPYWVDPRGIDLYDGAGLDADQDGLADPYNPRDSVFAAARQLAVLLASHNNNYEDSLTEYLHGDVDMARRVIGKARLYTVFTLPGISMIWPISPDMDAFDLITSPFGMRRHPISGEYKLHTGVDIGVAEGTSILASHSGKVVSSGYRGAYGHCIIIQSLDGSMETLYAHMRDHPLWEYGEMVGIGSVVGYVGSTGNSTGNHLHFEVRLQNNGGEPSDPLSMVNPHTTLAKILDSPFTEAGEFAAQFDVARPSGLDPASLEAFMLSQAGPASIYWQYQGEMGPALIEAERQYGVNAAFLACLAVHESNWGSSAIARRTNNVFGWQAYNSNPDAARQFGTMTDGIMYVARRLSSQYLNPTGEYYHGTSISGINYRYCETDDGAADWGWSRDIAALIQNLYSGASTSSAGSSGLNYDEYSGYYRNS